ncbi:uncharacterized protein LOC142409205 [Mycteria americana]|uniref:uncharacterized protein LOC142409205 n=1 Tax=Mycteria americana TaxID=33587 RepID=UPI003F582731
MPAGSKMDPPLAKAEPISDGGSASGITYLRTGEKKPVQLQLERGVRICERNNSADTKGSEEGGAGGAPGAGAEIPLQPMVKTMVRQAVPLKPMEVHGGADIHLQPMEDPMLEQVAAPEGGCDPMGSLRCSRLLAGPVDPWREEPTLEQVSVRTCDPIGNPRWSSLFLKDCTLWKGPTLEQFVKNCSPWEGLTLEQGKSLRRSDRVAWVVTGCPARVNPPQALTLFWWQCMQDIGPPQRQRLFDTICFTMSKSITVPPIISVTSNLWDKNDHLLEISPWWNKVSSADLSAVSSCANYFQKMWFVDWSIPAVLLTALACNVKPPFSIATE